MHEYLVYRLMQPETGTEGYSHYAWYEVIEAISEQEAILAYCNKRNVRLVTISEDGRVFDYSEIVANKLPSMVDGSIRKLIINENVI